MPWPRRSRWLDLRSLAFKKSRTRGCCSIGAEPWHAITTSLIRGLYIEGNDFFTEQDVGMMHSVPTAADTAAGSMPASIRCWWPCTAAPKLSAVTSRWLMCPSILLSRLMSSAVTLRSKSRSSICICVPSREAAEIRTRQARLVHAWVAREAEARRECNCAGDANTEQSVFPAQPRTDMHVLVGQETADTADDLIDLNEQLPVDQRQTHLLNNKMFDRILVSKSLMQDDPHVLTWCLPRCSDSVSYRFEATSMCRRFTGNNTGNYLMTRATSATMADHGEFPMEMNSQIFRSQRPALALDDQS